jgi:hypothetical protein
LSWWEKKKSTGGDGRDQKGILHWRRAGCQREMGKVHGTWGDWLACDRLGTPRGRRPIGAQGEVGLICPHVTRHWLLLVATVCPGDGGKGGGMKSLLPPSSLGPRNLRAFMAGPRSIIRACSLHQRRLGVPACLTKLRRIAERTPVSGGTIRHGRERASASRVAAGEQRRGRGSSCMGPHGRRGKASPIGVFGAIKRSRCLAHLKSSINDAPWCGT